MADITSAEQLSLWVQGNPEHRGEKGDPLSECCPDFSCCIPGLLAPIEERKRFASGDRSLLGVFLGRAIAREAQGKDVYIAGRNEEVRRG